MVSFSEPLTLDLVDPSWHSSRKFIVMQDLDCAPSVTNYVTWAVKFSGSLSLVLCVIGISRLAIPLVGQGGMGPGREKSVVGHSGMGPLHGENFVDRMAQGFGMERAWWPG